MILKPVNGKTTIWLAALMFLAGIAATYFTGFGEVRSDVRVQTMRVDGIESRVNGLDTRLDRIETKLDQLLARR